MFKMRALEQNFIFFTLSALFYANTKGTSHQLNNDNLEQILNGHEFVLVNFYADWCRFSQILSPVFEEAAKKVTAEFPEPGKVALAKVDCDRESAIASKYHVTKYPTLKIFRNGELVKREYRGQRSVEALANYVKEQVRDPIGRISQEQLETLDRKKRHVIGYFENEDSDDYINYRKVASSMRDDCVFNAALGTVGDSQRFAGNKISFRAPGDKPDMHFTGQLTNFDLLKVWITDKCLPLVREITFENAEELTEEGIPFLILFHDEADTETPEKYRKQVALELSNEKNSINALTADGKKFSHPLYHLGKTTNDLPILAIDSFRHMYLWPKNAKEDIGKPGLLRAFVADLHSGKLHREFHHGPDASQGDSDGQVAVQTGAGGSVQVVGGTADDKNAEHPAGDHVHVQMQQQLIITPDGTPLQVIRIQQTGHQQDKVGIKELEKEAAKENKELEDLAGDIPSDIVDMVEEVQEEVANANSEELQRFIDGLPKTLQKLSVNILERIPSGSREKVQQYGLTPEIIADFSNELIADLPEVFKKGVDIEGIRQQRIQQALSGDLSDDGEEVDGDDHLVVHEDTKTLLVKKREESEDYDDTASSQPPQSMFKHLFPSETRYTLLRNPRDEL